MTLKTGQHRGAKMESESVGDKCPLSVIQLAYKKIHARTPHETGDEFIRGALVDIDRRIELLQFTCMHDRYPMGQRHSLSLVMGHVKRCGSQFILQMLEFTPRVNAKIRIQIGKGLVHQKDSGLRL